MLEYKKSYVVPNTQITYAEICNILASSENTIAAERYNYLCPCIPETRCRKYNRFIRYKNGVRSLSSEIVWHKRVSVPGKEDCPYVENCEQYKRYCELTNNGNQH